MSKQTTALAFTILLTLFLSFGCFRRVEPIVYTEYTPIFVNKSALKNSVKLQAATNITDAAKIYYKDQYIFISEYFKGVHIIDNADPSNPINKAFISVLGCVDMAIKNDVLYIDNAIDFVSIDLNEIKNGNLKILKRIENIFPEVAPPDAGAIPDKFNEKNRPEGTIIVGWKK